MLGRLARHDSRLSFVIVTLVKKGTNMKTLKFQIRDHGQDGEQYFQGCGTFGTMFTEVSTGVGESAYEAALDAWEQICTDGEQIADVDSTELEAAIEDLDKTEIKRTYDACEGSKCDGCEGCNDEWHHYVSIRWAIKDES